jgi:hypothetical protein
MALSVPNLDRLEKENPKLAETIRKIQNYINANVTPVAGNRVNPPPTNPVNPPG